jgi:hypothetical protein
MLCASQRQRPHETRIRHSFNLEHGARTDSQHLSAIGLELGVSTPADKKDVILTSQKEAAIFQ